MPWKECNAMDERLRFVARLRDEEKMAAVCREFGISRKTGYKIFVTDKLRSYGVAHWELIPEVIHINDQYANNRTELSHQPTRVRERGMRGPATRKFKLPNQAQRFLGVHAAVYNLLNLGRHLV
jgi:transposase-like protein